MKKTIKLWYTDFYEGFDPSANIFQELLAESYSIKLDSEKPDYLIFSCYGKDFLNYQNCIRIFYTGENLVPDFNLCDYAIGFSYLNFEDRYLRYPNFAFIEDQFEDLLKSRSFTQEDLRKKEIFCNFIYSNSKADPVRDNFFHLLNNKKKVLSPGNHLNNASMPIGDRFSENWMYSKLHVQLKSKFTIAFENSSSPGYTTEKLMHAFITNTVPIYWGNPEVARDFNSKAFINCHDFESLNGVVEEVLEIDKNDTLFLSILNEPPFQNNEIPKGLQRQTLESFLISIFDQNFEKAFRRPFHGTTANYDKDLKKKFLTRKDSNSMVTLLRRVHRALRL